MKGRMEDTDLYLRACRFSDEVYEAVRAWPAFPRETFGGQLVRSLDSVAANLVEGDGRGLGLDAIRFFRISRGSCREMRHWIARAKARKLIDEERANVWLGEATELVKMIQGLIRYRQDHQSQVRESFTSYDDPFVE